MCWNVEKVASANVAFSSSNCKEAAPWRTTIHSCSGWSYQKPSGEACPCDTILSIRSIREVKTVSFNSSGKHSGIAVNKLFMVPLIHVSWQRWFSMTVERRWQWLSRMLSAFDFVVVRFVSPIDDEAAIGSDGNTLVRGHTIAIQWPDAAWYRAGQKHMCLDRLQ